jgi:putative ABC transport system permease protein
MESGAFFSDADVSRSAKVALLGALVRDQLFGENADPTGETIRINNQPFVVDGVLARKGQSATGQDQDDTVIVPYTTVMKKLSGNTWLSTVTVAAAGEDQMPAVSAAITDLLRQRHRLTAADPDDFNVRTLEEMMSVLTATTSTMTWLLASVAAVSLIVGGIGVMNIMLVSVTERTREIGLRLSIGARKRDVLTQFLVESLALSLVGGVAGILVGVGASFGVSRLLAWSVSISPVSVALSFACAAAIGGFFGIYPARRAAALSPIEALRYE